MKKIASVPVATALLLGTAGVAHASPSVSAGALAPAGTAVPVSAATQDVRTPVMGVVAWGENAGGQLDVPVKARAGVTAVAAGHGFSVALKDGEVISWGDVGCKSRLTFNQVDQPALTGVDAIAAGDCQVMALRDGEVIAWGSAYAPPGRFLPEEAKSGVTAIATSHTVPLAVKEGRVISWSRGTTEEATVPIEAQSGVVDVATSGGFSMALKDDGQVVTWGRAASTDLGQVPVEAQSGVTAIATNGSQAMALKDGAVIAWGENGAGQTDVPLEAQSGVTAIVASQGSSFSIGPDGPVLVPGGVLSAVKDGRVITWGINRDGDVRVPLEAQSGVTAIAASDTHSLALAPAEARVKVKPVKGRSKLFVNVNPNKGKGYWKFQVQKMRLDGSWKPLKTYRTKGKKETRTINRKKGTYRVVVKPKYGYQGTTSDAVWLRR